MGAMRSAGGGVDDDGDGRWRGRMMARDETLVRAGVDEVVKSIMLSTRNQNGREVGRVASQTRKGSETEGERRASIACPQRGQAQAYLLQARYVWHKYATEIRVS